VCQCCLYKCLHQRFTLLEMNPFPFNGSGMPFLLDIHMVRRSRDAAGAVGFGVCSCWGASARERQAAFSACTFQQKAGLCICRSRLLVSL
jgi:hypothetical protein